MSNPVLICENLSKTYSDGDLSVSVLKGLDFSLNKGQSAAIIGASGSGKSTLLQLLGGLDQPTEGEIFINRRRLSDLSARQLAKMRNHDLGFVYQFHHLLPEFTAMENVAMPLLIRRTSDREARQAAQAILKKVGLADRCSHKPAELSGGERQRVAIARALVTRPSCLLADEPTGNLDHKTSQGVFDQFLALNREFETTLLIVTHDRAIARQMDATFLLEDGTLSVVEDAVTASTA